MNDINLYDLSDKEITEKILSSAEAAQKDFDYFKDDINILHKQYSDTEKRLLRLRASMHNNAENSIIKIIHGIYGN